jgi:hypothetical protein
LFTTWISSWLSENYPDMDPTLLSALAAAIAAFAIYYLFIKKKKK